MLGEIIGEGLSLAGANAAEEQYRRRKKAYDNMIKKANATQQAGESAFNDVINTQNPYLNVIGQDLKNQTNDVLNAGRNQLNASLAQQGVRGGQAATQLARGIGN